MKIRRIGVLTAGGDCPGLNAVVRGVAKHAINCGIEVLGFKNGFDGLVKNQFMVLDAKAVSGILTRGGTILGTSNLANPFKYTLYRIFSVFKYLFLIFFETFKLSAGPMP